ncbi:hypothetical protein O3P69_006200 [Scylla paramamosain]|uniref:Uncharacterized protein n=1 Tax=Scylla paramamosain TaxID=85552 RepID=A0AAW0U5M3_SCYPA
MSLCHSSLLAGACPAQRFESPPLVIADSLLTAPSPQLTPPHPTLTPPSPTLVCHRSIARSLVIHCSRRQVQVCQPSRVHCSVDIPPIYSKHRDGVAPWPCLAGPRGRRRSVRASSGRRRSAGCVGGAPRARNCCVTSREGCRVRPPAQHPTPNPRCFTAPARPRCFTPRSFDLSSFLLNVRGCRVDQRQGACREGGGDAGAPPLPPRPSTTTTFTHQNGNSPTQPHLLSSPLVRETTQQLVHTVIIALDCGGVDGAERTVVTVHSKMDMLVMACWCDVVM